MSRYEDILGETPPRLRHPRMPRRERAKLFAPFAALSGHSQAVHQREQVLVPRTVMAPYTQNILNEKLQTLEKGDWVTVVYFVPQQRKAGEEWGIYQTISGNFQEIAPEQGKLYLREKRIPLADVMDIRRQKREE